VNTKRVFLLAPSPVFIGWTADWKPFIPVGLPFSYNGKQCQFHEAKAEGLSLHRDVLEQLEPKLAEPENLSIYLSWLWNHDFEIDGHPLRMKDRSVRGFAVSRLLINWITFSHSTVTAIRAIPEVEAIH
jgi:hypothetical protein